MGYPRPSTVAIDGDLDTFSWGSPTRAWPNKRILCPYGCTRDKGTGLPSWKQAIGAFLEQGEPYHYILLCEAQDLGLLRVCTVSEG